APAENRCRPDGASRSDAQSGNGIPGFRERLALRSIQATALSLISQCGAVLARIRSAGERPALPIDADRLTTAPWGLRDSHLVTAALETFDRGRRDAALDERLAPLEERSGKVDRALHVHPVIDDVEQKMGVAHRLEMAAHDAERDLAPPIPRRERRNDGVHR